MPKIHLTQEERQDVQLHALVQKYRTIREVSSETLAKKMGMSMPTYYRKIKEGHSLTMREIRSLQSGLRIPREELLAALEV